MEHEILSYIDRPVDLLKLVKNLTISEDNLEREARIQPKYYLEASRYKVQCMWQKQRLMAKFESLKAEKGLKLRKMKFGKGDGRVTEKEIESRVIADEEVKKLRIRLERAFQLLEFAQQLVEAYRQRQSVLKVLSDIRNAEIANEIRSVREGMARKEMEKMSSKARAALRQRGLDTSEEDDE